MANVNAHDRSSLERAYPESAFADDAAQNELVQKTVIRGVRIGSAPDAAGDFGLERATRHVGEPETPDFLAPVRRGEELADRGGSAAPTKRSGSRPPLGYRQFLDDIVVAAERFGFRSAEAPGPGEVRLRGLRQ